MYSETPDIIPFPTSFRGELLTQAELETIKGGTLRLLDEVGVHFPSRQALQIMADHGARINMETQIVRIPPDLVQKAMSTAPRTFVLGVPSPEVVRIYDAVLAANQSGRLAIRPGMAAQEVDRIARRAITLAGYGEYFIHRAGHGLGHHEQSLFGWR